MEMPKIGDETQEISAETTIKEEKTPSSDSLIGHEHIYTLITGKEIGWQAIIYDLINTERLDPWNLDLAALTRKYLEKIKELEEANFYISSNVILAASLLLRIKTEILLDKYITSIDEILYGKKEQENKSVERLIIDEDELPLIYPKSPMPRMRKVTLQELIKALGKAMKTESRRIKKEISTKYALREAEVVFPKTNIHIKDRIKIVYAKVLGRMKMKKQKVSYTELIGTDKEERVASFLPVLHLDNQMKVFLEQEQHFEEIYVWLYKHYKEEVLDKEVKDLETLENVEKIAEMTGFDNPLGEMLEG